MLLNILVLAIAISYAYSILGENNQAKHKNSIIISLTLFKLFFITHLFIDDNLIRRILFFSSISLGLVSITYYFSRYISKTKKNFLDHSKLVFYISLLFGIFFKINFYPYADLILIISFISLIPILAQKFKKPLTQK